MSRLASSITPARDINDYFGAIGAALAAEAARPAQLTLSCRIFGHEFELQADDTFNLWTSCARCGCPIRQ